MNPVSVPIRKRMKRREVPGMVRFVTASCQRRLPRFSSPAIADVFTSCLPAARARWRFELFAFVVMPEHVHLLVRPSESVALDRALVAPCELWKWSSIR